MMEYIGLYEDPEYGILERFTETKDCDNGGMDKLRFILGRSMEHRGYEDVLLHLVNKEESLCGLAVNCFNYGAMVGKQRERVRRAYKEKRKKQRRAAEVSSNELSSMAIQFGQTHSPEEVRASQKEIQSIFDAYWKLAVTVSEQQKITAPDCNPEAVTNKLITQP